MTAVGGLIDIDPEKIQSGADACAYRRRVFADAAGKYQCVHTAERRGKRADPFLCLVAKQRKGLGGTRITGFTIEQISDVGAGLRNPE